MMRILIITLVFLHLVFCETSNGVTEKDDIQPTTEELREVPFSTDIIISDETLKEVVKRDEEYMKELIKEQNEINEKAVIAQLISEMTTESAILLVKIVRTAKAIARDRLNRLDKGIEYISGFSVKNYFTGENSPNRDDL